MSDVFKPVTKMVKQTASRGIVSKLHRYKPAAQLPGSPEFNVARTLERSSKDDTTILEDNPTTPLSDSDSATKINDPLNLTGEPKADAQRDADEESARVAAQARANLRPLPDEEEIARQQKRSAARRRSSGRSSTIVSDASYGSDSLGG